MAVRQLTATDAAERLSDGTATLLDVREDRELAIAAVEGALHIPMSEVPHRLETLRKARADRELIVMCHSGMRSQRVAEFLNQQGLSGVFNLEGGIDAWSRDVDASVPRY